MSQQFPHNPDQPQQPQWGQAPQPTQPYPGQPQQPFQGAPGGWGGGPVPPQGPKKPWVARHKVLTAVGGLFAFVVIVGIAAGGGDDKSDTKADTAASSPATQTDDKAADKPAEKPATKPAAPVKKEKPAPKPKSQADQFKAFINANGTAAEKAAAKHIVKVQGADSSNDLLDAADVYTDYSGGLMGPHQGEGKLLASAFADWRDSKNGLVTVYDKAGELLSNGNY